MYKAFLIAAIIAATIIIIPSPVNANTIVSSNTYSTFPNGINTTQICINGDCETNWPTSGSGLSGLSTSGVLVATNSTSAETPTGIEYVDTQLTLRGENSATQSDATAFRIINTGTVDDTTGASGRTKISLWSGGSSLPNNRALSIEAHSNFTQPREVTFYSSLKNNTLSAKAFQWDWGENTTGNFEMVHLDRIQFPSGYSGFYSNVSLRSAGLLFPDNSGSVFLDSDSDSSSTVSFSVYADGTTESSPIIRAHSIGGVSRLGVGSTSTTGLLNIGSGSNGDIIYIDGERDWKFTLNGSGASTELNLVDMGNAKPFSIVSPTSYNKVATFIPHDTGTSERVYLARNDGKVGVNTTSPSYTFDVNGQSNADELCINGDCRTSWPSGSGGLSGQYFAGYNYLVWRNGSTYVAQNVTGGVLTTSASAHLVINAAINNITTTESAGGGRVQLSCQEFLLTDSIRINKSMITLEGCGSGTKMNVSGFTGKPMINITGNSVVHVTVRNLHMNGQSASGVTPIYINTPYSQGDTEHLIENIKIWEAGRYAVQIEGDTRVVQLNNIYSRTAGIDAFRIEGSDHKFDMLTSEGAACNGFYLAGGNIHMMNSKAFGNGATGGNTCAGMTIYGRLTTVVGSEVQDNYHCGVYIDDPDTYNVLLSSNVYDTNGRANSINNASVCINNAHDIIVTASQFINRDGARNQSYAFKVTGTSENMSFVANDYSLMGINPYSFSTAANYGNATIIGNTGQNKSSIIESLTLRTLAGTGNDYACLDSNGALFRSNTAC